MAESAEWPDPSELLRARQHMHALREQARAERANKRYSSDEVLDLIREVQVE